MLNGCCPQCGKDIPQSRYVTGFAICECGWHDTRSARLANRNTEMQTIRAMIIGSIVMAAVYAHLVSWGTYAVEIPFVKVAQMTGLLSVSGHQDLANTCIAFNKWSCAKNAYRSLYLKTRDVGAIAQLANLEDRLGEAEAARATYESYFAAGGKDATAAVAFARLLESAGKTDKAMKFFELGVANSGALLPVNATGGIVRLMIKQGKYEDAVARIEDFHASAGNAVGYLNIELEQLHERLAKQAKGRKPAKKASGAKKIAARL